MAKQLPKKPLGQPPHPLAGTYRDRCGALFVVPNKPEFALFRLSAEGELTSPESPIQNKPDEFKAAVAYGTFTKQV